MVSYKSSHVQENVWNIRIAFENSTILFLHLIFCVADILTVLINECCRRWRGIMRKANFRLYINILSWSFNRVSLATCPSFQTPFPNTKRYQYVSPLALLTWLEGTMLVASLVTMQTMVAYLATCRPTRFMDHLVPSQFSHKITSWKNVEDV